MWICQIPSRFERFSLFSTYVLEGTNDRKGEKSLFILLLQTWCDCFWTENPYISEKVKHLFPTIKAYTVSNYYNQVFDDENTQIEHALPSFDGCTLLSINAPYPHKNLAIAIEVARYLKNIIPNLVFDSFLR